MQAARQTERPEQSQESKADGGLLLSHQGPQASPLGRLKTLTLNSPFLSVEQSSVVTILSQQSKMELLTLPATSVVWTLYVDLETNSPLQGVCETHWEKARKEEEQSLPRMEALGDPEAVTGKHVAVTGATSSHRTEGQGPPAGLFKKKEVARTVFRGQDVSHRAVEGRYADDSGKTNSSPSVTPRMLVRSYLNGCWSRCLPCRSGGPSGTSPAFVHQDVFEGRIGSCRSGC